MPFPTLEDRFKQSEANIYGRFSNKESLIEIKPNSTPRPREPRSIKYDERWLPVISTLREAERKAKLLASAKGVLFISKQLALQTGNTFAETRVYNPAELILALGTPLRRLPRHISGISGKAKDNFTSDKGALQSETVGSFGLPGKRHSLVANANFVSVPKNPTILSRILGTAKPTRTTDALLSKNEQFYIRPEDNHFAVTGPILYTGQLLSERGKKKLGASGQLIYSHEVKKSIFENWDWSDGANITLQKWLRHTGATLFPPQPTSERKNKYVTGSANTIQNTAIDNSTNQPRTQIGNVTEFYKQGDNKGRIFRRLEETKFTNPYFSGVNWFKSPDEQGNDVINNAAKNRTPNIGDKYNRSYVNSDELTGKILYAGVYSENERTVDRSERSDIIRFAFQLADEKPMLFRALISSLTQATKPDFNEQRYVGRTERFVTYGGAKRTAMLEFNIVAFAENELDTVWAKINYLTGLAFPIRGSDAGFMTPPLFKISVGGIYENQPCYVDSLDYDFIEEAITFDIDKEVPQYINVKMSITLLEKRSKFYDSPFYGIVESLPFVQVSVTSPVPAATTAATSISGAEITANPLTPNPDVFVMFRGGRAGLVDRTANFEADQPLPKTYIDYEARNRLVGQQRTERGEASLNRLRGQHGRDTALNTSVDAQTINNASNPLRRITPIYRTPVEIEDVSLARAPRPLSILNNLRRQNPLSGIQTNPLRNNIPTTFP